MGGRAVGRAGGAGTLPAEDTQLLKHVAPYETLLCEKIRKEASLTPPAVIDDLCEGVPTRWICFKAAYAEEVLEIARMLGRSHLLRFEADC
jgi:hypothetical protein